jgi:predicted transcriptional regulator
MVTTIQISEELKERLALRKMSPKDKYEDIIWDLLEDTLELSEQTKNEIAQARDEYVKGEFVTHAQVKKELGL